MATSLQTDPNWNRLFSWYEPIKRRLPSAAAEYVVEKFPVAQWLPHYNYRWALQDIIGGVTIGVMFIPQGLAYAKIATIPVEHGLYSSWVPSALYFFLGTSKGRRIEPPDGLYADTFQNSPRDRPRFSASSLLRSSRISPRRATPPPTLRRLLPSWPASTPLPSAS